MLSRSFGFVGFIRALPCGRRVHSGTLGSFERALVSLVTLACTLASLGSFERAHGVVGCILVRCVNSGPHLGLSGSFALVEFILPRPFGGRVHSGRRFH